MIKPFVAFALLNATHALKVTWFSYCLVEGETYKAVDTTPGVPDFLPGNWYQIKQVGGDWGGDCATQKWTVVDAAAHTYTQTKSSNGYWYWPFPGSVDTPVTCPDGKGNCAPTTTGDFKTDETIVFINSIFAMQYKCQPHWWFLGKEEKMTILSRTETLDAVWLNAMEE